MLEIFPAETKADYQHVRELIAEYIAWDSSRTSELGLDVNELLAFQYSQGSESIPGDYIPPEGCLLLATHDAKIAGCGAVHKLASDICEMKRVYVRPQFRGLGIGRQLASTLIATATEAGYRLMRLETVTFMEGAISLYTSLGFHTRDAYYVIPENFRQITVFMELDLQEPGRSALSPPSWSSRTRPPWGALAHPGAQAPPIVTTACRRTSRR